MDSPLATARGAIAAALWLTLAMGAPEPAQATGTSSVATRSISATPASLWDSLTDSATYPYWDWTIAHIEGQMAAGRRIVIIGQGPERRPFAFMIREFEPERSMVWTRDVLPALLEASLTFTLEPTDDGRVTFSLRQTYAGPLARGLAPLLPDPQPLLEQFAADLKRHTSLP